VAAVVGLVSTAPKFRGSDFRLLVEYTQRAPVVRREDGSRNPPGVHTVPRLEPHE
jgi:hypothetical protein